MRLYGRLNDTNWKDISFVNFGRNIQQVNVVSRSANQLTIVLVSIVSLAIRYTYELMGRWVALHLAAATDGNGDRVPAGGVP